MDKNEVAKLQMNRPPKAQHALCPFKDPVRVKWLQRHKGEDHSEEGHFCAACSCKNPAGQSTDHVGYGLCAKHEAKVDAEVAIRIARDHRVALQSHEPFLYRSPNKWLRKIQEEAASAQKKVSLDAEIDAARSLVQEVIELCRAKRTMTDPQILQKLSNIEVQLGLDNYSQALQDISDIRVALTSPMTVNTSSGLQPMSDDRRLQRLNTLLGTVGKLGLAKMRITRDDVWTKDEVKRMFSQFAVIAQEAIMDPDADRNVVMSRFVERLTQAERRMDKGQGDDDT